MMNKKYLTIYLGMALFFSDYIAGFMVKQCLTHTHL
jgi:hypothetical protein